MCDRRYVAVVDSNTYNAATVLKPSVYVKLKKEYNNNYDQEAIEVSIDNFGKIGYIANSVKTVPKGCFSGGRIYDSFEDTLLGIIRFVLNETAIVELIYEDEDENEDEELEKNFILFTNILQNLFCD